MCRLVRSLPESLRDSATAAAREAMIDLGLDAIAAVQPPLGYGRTDWRATTCWPKHGTVLGRDKSWGSPCSPAKRRLRVAPVPPQATDLTWPARGARTMPGRDEATGTAIEPRNNHDRVRPCRHDSPTHTIGRPTVGETEASLTRRSSDNPV